MQSDVERFAAAVKESERAERAAREHRAHTAAEAAQKVQDAKTAAADLAASRRDLERAVDAVRRAKQGGAGRAAADEAWKVAKARVIELETGSRPSWAPQPPPGDADPDDSASDATTETPDPDDAPDPDEPAHAG